MIQPGLPRFKDMVRRGDIRNLDFIRCDTQVHKFQFSNSLGLVFRFQETVGEIQRFFGFHWSPIPVDQALLQVI